MIVIAEANFSLMINILIAVVTGLFVSIFTTITLYCGYFLMGILAGFVTGFIFLMVYTTFLSLNSVALPCVIIAAFGLFQVFITMWWRHRVYIVSSCLFASAAMAASLDYFVENFFILKYIELKVFYNRIADLCWWSYLIIGLWPAFFIAGLLVQCLVTGKERQKQNYTFIYKRKKRRQDRDRDELIQHGSNRYQWVWVYEDEERISTIMLRLSSPSNKRTP